MTARNPVEFVRSLTNGLLQRAGNRVQIEDAGAQLIGAANPLPTSDTALLGALNWTTDSVVSTTNDNSNKTFAVTAGQIWTPLGIRVQMVSTATVGNRILSVQFETGAGVVLFGIVAGVAQAASLTRHYQFGVGMPDSAAFRGPGANQLFTPIVPAQLSAGMVIRVWDSAAIAAAADDMHVQIIYNRLAV